MLEEGGVISLITLPRVLLNKLNERFGWMLLEALINRLASTYLSPNALLTVQFISSRISIRDHS
jgi:hypothetical protein